MAEHAVNAVASALTGELTNRVFSGLIRRYGKDAATSHKMQRLEMMLIKIHSAIEASEKRSIENSWLLRWRDKLKEAASQGDEVLASFPPRGEDCQATSNTNNVNQQQHEAVSSSASAPTTDVGALPFTGKSLSEMVQGICNFRYILFSSMDNGMERLNRTLGSLEKLSPDIGEFIRLLHLEALPKVDQTPCNAVFPTKVNGRTEMWEMREKKRMKRSEKHTNLSSPLKEQMTEECPENLDVTIYSDDDKDLDFIDPTLISDLVCESLDLKKEQWFVQLVLQGRLKAALAEISMAVELANSRCIEDLEWLAYWDGILREAKEQGFDVLRAIRLHKTFKAEDKEFVLGGIQEKDELNSFVQRQEELARDVGYFKKLVDLCLAC